MKPEQCHAIVVGIEKFEIDEAWNLSGPAVDGAGFIKWLRDRQVPAKNISFFATPLAENQAALATVDVPYKPADSKTIMDAVTVDFAQRRGDLLFILWGGHGVIGEGSRRLFFSDVSQNRLLNVDLEKLRDFLHSSFMPGFAKQVIFVDACANYFELQQPQAGLSTVPVVPGQPRQGTSQFILFAAGDGERAKNLGALRKGLFSSILIDELKIADWPPDLMQLKSRIDRQFADLRATGKASQTPRQFYSRDWNGDEDTEYAWIKFDLSPAEQDLADALIACPVMQTPGQRNGILGELRALGVEAVERIIDNADQRIHSERIVSVLNRSGDRGALIAKVVERTIEKNHADRLLGVQLEIDQQLFDHATIRKLRELLEPLELEQAKVRRLFQECGRDLATGIAQATGGSYRLLLKLAGFPLQTSGFPIRALLFAEQLAGIVPSATATELREIVDRVGAQRNITAAIRAYRTGTGFQTKSDGISTLVFEMKPKAGGYLLRATFLDPVGNWTPLPTEDNPVGEAAAREKFRELVLQADEMSDRLIIEMAVTREMFYLPFDRWEIDVGGYPAVVGAHFPVVLRWLDRLREVRYQKRWSAKWQTVKSYSGHPLWLSRADQFQPSQLLAILDQASDAGAFISFAFPPSRTPEPRGDALSVVLSGGTPVVVWCRECDPDPGVAQEELESLFARKSLEDLPAIFRTVRNEAAQKLDPNHPGHRIVLLFDSHDHRPPQLTG